MDTTVGHEFVLEHVPSLLALPSCLSNSSVIVADSVTVKTTNVFSVERRALSLTRDEHLCYHNIGVERDNADKQSLCHHFQYFWHHKFLKQHHINC